MANYQQRSYGLTLIDVVCFFTIVMSVRVKASVTVFTARTLCAPFLRAMLCEPVEATIVARFANSAF